MRTFTLEAIPQGSQVTLLATLLEDGAGLEGRTIYFDVTGANTTSGTDTTDFDGEATFVYEAGAEGTDNAFASWGDPDGLDLVYGNLVAPASIERLDGFSATPVDSFALGFIPAGVGYDGDNLLTVDASAGQTIKRHAGISATVTDSLTFSLGAPIIGVAWTRENNLVVATATTVYVCDGFSTTVLSSFGSPYHAIQDLGYDGENLLISTRNLNIDSRSFRMVGVTSTVDTSFVDGTGGASAAKGITSDGTDVVIARGDGVGGITDEIKKGTGFGTPYQDTALIANEDPAGLIWTAALYAQDSYAVSFEEGWGMLV